MRQLLSATLTRMLKVEATALRRMAAKPGKFLDAVDDFYASYRDTLAEAVAPVMTAAAEALGVVIPTRAGWVRRVAGGLLDRCATA
jgi:hypothetical protein